MYFNSKQRKRFNSTGAKSSVSWIIVFALMSLVFASMGFAATIQGISFNDINADGIYDTKIEDIIPTGRDVSIVNIETLDINDTRTDVNGNYSFTGLAPGTYTVWIPIPTSEGCWIRTTPLPKTEDTKNRAVVKLTSQTEIKTLNFGFKQIYPNNPNDIQLPDPQSICQDTNLMIHSVKSGDWNSAGTWDKGIPNKGDCVEIERDHTITVSDPIDLGEGGLINYGTIKSVDNQSGKPVSKVEIHALKVDNSGIIGKECANLVNGVCSDKTMNGVDGNCFAQATPGSSIEIWTSLFNNSDRGIIAAGDGGNNDNVPINGCTPWESCYCRAVVI